MPENSAKYEAIIGLEVHAQLNTDSKIFCSCNNEFGADANTHACPVCLGLPGVLPVLNHKVVEYAIKMGLATNCKIGVTTNNCFKLDDLKGLVIDFG